MKRNDRFYNPVFTVIIREGFGELTGVGLIGKYSCKLHYPEWGFLKFYPDLS